MPHTELRNLMVEECTAEWMEKMSKQQECVRHMAFMASDGTSVTDLSNHCKGMNQRFTVADARQLCEGLTDVHQQFWPRFHTSEGP